LTHTVYQQSVNATRTSRDVKSSLYIVIFKLVCPFDTSTIGWHAIISRALLHSHFQTCLPVQHFDYRMACIDALKIL